MNKTVSNLEEIVHQWGLAIANTLPKLFLGLVVLVVFVVLARLAKRTSFAFYRKTLRQRSDVASIFSTIIYFFLLLSGIFMALQVAGLEATLTHILAGAGIVGIVAGFAFKDIASNMFAGLILMMQTPFKTGDWVEIDGQYGFVLDVGWVTTKIRTVPGQEVYVPNQIVYSGTFTNFSTSGKRRIILNSGVAYGEQLDRVREIALDEAGKIPGLLPNEGIDFYFTGIGNSAYNFMLRFWIKFESNDDFCKGMNNAIMHIKQRFDQEKISIAYPVTTLDFGVKGGVNLFDKDIHWSAASAAEAPKA